MAWISVHEQVMGLKLRSLSKAIGCSQKEALGILVSLWLWGINNADSEGVLKSAERNDIIAVLSIGLSTGMSAEKILDCLVDEHWIDEKDGIFILHDWDIWQEEWYKALNRRAYDASRKRDERRKSKSNCPSECPQDSPQDNPVQPSPSPSPSPINNDTDNNNKLTFAGNVFLTPDQYKAISHKFKKSDFPALKANQYITKLSFMKSQGYQSDNDFSEVLKLIDVESGQQHAEGSMS